MENNSNLEIKKSKNEKELERRIEEVLIESNCNLREMLGAATDVFINLFLHYASINNEDMEELEERIFDIHQSMIDVYADNDVSYLDGIIASLMTINLAAHDASERMKTDIISTDDNVH